MRHHIFLRSFCASLAMSDCVRPERSDPSFLRYLALACANACDNFLSAARADRERRLTGFDVEASLSRSARLAPSDSRSEVISRNNAMYSSGVSIMSLAKGIPSSRENFGLNKSCVGACICTGTVAPQSTSDVLRNSVAGTL